MTRPRRAIADIAMRPRLALTLFVLVLTAILLLTVPRPLSPDVAGQLWIADCLRHGARLYLDISEINPPLWFWMALPVEALAEALGVEAESVLIVTIAGAALLALLAASRVSGDCPPAIRVAVLLYGACMLIVMPLRDLGQREQIVLIAAVPYAALIAARREGRPVAAWLAVTIALGAAAGFALKHYFIGVPLLLELWLALAWRRAWRPVRIETLVLAACAAGYGAAILIATPEYVRVTLPELKMAYAAFGAPELRYMVRPAQPIWALIVSGIVVQHRVNRRALPAITTAFLVAAGGFGLAWLLQHKGWPYQSVATTGTLALALATLAVDGASRVTVPRSPVVIAALAAPLLLFVVPTQWVPTPETDIAPALHGLRPGDTVAIVSREGRTAWPATIGRGLRFAGRRGSYWMFDAIDANAAGAQDPAIEAFGRRVVREAVLDYRCAPPKRIVFTPGRAPSSVTTASDNPLGYFLRDAAFAQLLRHYRRLDLPGDFDAFEMVTAPQSVPTGPCPRI